MAFCKDCGTDIAQGVAFCPQCGAATAAEPAAPVAPAQPAEQGSPADKLTGAFNKFNDTADSTAEFDSADIQQNKVMAILAYFGPLVLIPWFAAPNSKFARFHAKQGVNLCLLYVAYGIIAAILNAIKFTRTEYVFGVPVEYSTTPWFISLIVWLLSIVVGIFAVIGIINAAKGKAKELPIIGKIKLFK